MSELIHAFTETHYKDYPAYINISRNAGEQAVLIVREQENNGMKYASIKLSNDELEHLAKDINSYLGVEDTNYTELESKLAASEDARKRAEVELEGSRKQEPVGYLYDDEFHEVRPPASFPEIPHIKLYKHPPIPPELSEVMRERDELKRKLAEQESHNNFDAARLRRLVSFCGVSAPDSDEELLQVAGVVIGSCLRVLQSPSSMIDPHSEIGVLKHHLSCKNSQIEELNRLLSEARKVPEWQPIETAPKGKPGFLATDEELSAIEWLIDDGEDDYFNVNSCNYTKSEHWKFWMPLPASPTYKEQP